ncbi:hypothetical protein FCI58_06710, partial [Enterobacter hormaechei]|nr:hypothetical protein [Enterobacter hormaechei]
ARRKAMECHLWNDKEGWYAEYDLKTGEFSKIIKS